VVAPRPDRIQIDYDLHFTTPFHFGTGMRRGIIDRTVQRDNNGYLYVPGSTFKGVLRERCEQLARFLGTEGQTDYRIESPHDPQAPLVGLGQKLSIITRLFGTQTAPGRLFFEDAHQSDPAFWNDPNDRKDPHNGRYKSLQVGISTQARLDHLTRIAVKDALYTSEFGIRDLTFKGCIRGWITCTPIDQTKEDGPTYALLLLLAGLQTIERMGANKSTGKGECICTITKLQLNETPPYEDATWQQWLYNLGALARYSAEN
jgi:CRISPR/Cas system CSM-associated protein Csm3 (group 7 of RAMP superfamily)